MNMKHENMKPHLYRLLSFLIPCGIMLLIFALNGKYPFGENALLESDAAAQYYPFLLLLRRVLRSGESLLYTWRAGLGTNLWALLSYYCFNPWNLIALALPESWMQLFLSLSICVRIGLAGLCTAILMQTISKKQSLAIPIFASLYGLSQWFVWNYFQLIWLDVAAMMPLLLAGMIRLVRDRRCKMFVAVLLLSLICNPYFSFITCVMTFLCWICALIILKKPIRSLPREAGRFFGCALLSGGMAAVVLVPLWFAIRSTGAALQSFPDLLTFPDSFVELLGRLVSFTYPVQHIGMPNLSCSMLSVLLFTGYLTAKRIPLRERLTIGGLLLFLLLSLWYPPLNYLWHGMHVPNGFIHRFAFLVPFVLLMAGWRFTETIDETDTVSLKKRLLQLVGMTAVGAALCVCGVVTDTSDIIFVSVLFMVLYILLYLWRNLKPQHQTAMLSSLLCIVCAETFCSTNLCVAFFAEEYLASDLEEQPEIQEAAEAIREDSGDQPQRIASAMGHGFNPELFSDLPYGGTLYSSLIPEALTASLSTLGMYSGSDLNRYFYQPLAPVSALMTGIRYVIAPEGGDYPEKFYAALGDTCAMRFNYDIPFGFAIPDTIGTNDADTTPECQNHIFKDIAETNNICKILPAEVTSANVEIEGSADDTIICKTGTEERYTLTYSFTADEDGDYSFDIFPENSFCQAIKRYDVLADGELQKQELFSKDAPYEHTYEMKYAGTFRKGQRIEIMLVLRPESEGALRVQAIRLDEEAFSNGLQLLDQYAMKNVQVQDTEITGTVTTDDSRKLLYLPVPYDQGWHAEIDGKTAEITEAMRGMLGLKLPAGTHKIRLSYRPAGLVAGCVISFISLAVCAAIWLLRRRSASNQSEENKCARSK